MNKEDVWQVIKAILKILIGIGVFVFLFMDHEWHFHGHDAGTFLFGGIAGWAITAWHFEKKRKADKWWEK